MSNGNPPKRNKCGLRTYIIFFLALFFGTGFSVCSKTIMTMPVNNNTASGSDGTDSDDNTTAMGFHKPLFLTFGMFVATLFGLVLHWVVLVIRIPFPGYEFEVGIEVDGVWKDDSPGGRDEKTVLLDASVSDGIGTPRSHDDGNVTVVAKRRKVPTWMYFYLAIPAIFDFAATIFCMAGLKYLDASIFQMLRGSGLIFVALMKQYVLMDRLYMFHWVGVVWIVISVAIVSSAAYFLSESSPSVTASQSLLGVCQIMIGTFFQACQFVSEEYLMRMPVPAPPLLLIGMEGFWGVLLCIVVMFPIGYYMPGADNGSYEDPFDTLDVFLHTKRIQVAFAIYLIITFFYNIFAVLVTFMLCSIWHAMLDNFRPITVWATELLIFYLVDPLYGEMWTKYSYLQIAGLVGLLYGTAIYNAPNGGSLRLEGQWWALGINFSKEYDAIRQEHDSETETEEGEYHRIII